MGENEAIGLATILKVIVGPLLLGAGLAYGIYRYRQAQWTQRQGVRRPRSWARLLLCLSWASLLSSQKASWSRAISIGLHPPRAVPLGRRSLVRAWIVRS